MNQEKTVTTTFRQLREVLQTIRITSIKPLPGFEGQNMSRYKVGICMDEVYPGIYVGDFGAAKNRDYLKKVGITHVLNTAQGESLAAVDTNAEFYKNYGIRYLGLELIDSPSANITQFFEESANFIDNALREGGKILVHCFMGISRSATIAISFLMLKREMTAEEALTQVRKNRDVYPNEGFLRQLAELDINLSGQKTQT